MARSPGARRARVSLATLAAGVLVVVIACSPAPAPTSGAPSGSVAPPVTSGSPGAATSGSPTSAPNPGRELYGYVPYWEMDEGIAAHLAGTPLTTLGLFSVTHGAKGILASGKRGYRLITGDIGRRLVREAHDRGTRVELVYTSFGQGRNRKLLESTDLQDTVIAGLVDLGGELGADGVNVDVEALDAVHVPAYGAFVGRLRAALLAADPADRVSVATGAGPTGAAMAAAAAQAGADRVFLMGYDYRTAGSSPGATSPLDRRDGDDKDLPWSLDLYAALGVPADRLVLGLPLYGYEWPVAGPVIGAPETGRGEAWILRRHLDLLTDEAVVPERDDVEVVEVYFAASDGTIGAPSPGVPAPTGSVIDPTWEAVYVDSPATLAPKMGLALDRGLAGTGFWAIGYERGLPDYTDLMRRFVAGEPLE